MPGRNLSSLRRQLRRSVRVSVLNKQRHPGQVTVPQLESWRNVTRLAFTPCSLSRVNLRQSIVFTVMFIQTHAHNQWRTFRGGDTSHPMPEPRL